MLSRGKLLVKLAQNNNADPIKSPDPTETYIEEDNRDDNIREQLFLFNDNNSFDSPDTSVRAIDIYTEDDRYVGSLEENVPGVLTELSPLQISNDFENIVKCCDNLKDNDVVLNSETQFIKITESCTIKNASVISFIQDKENLPSYSHLDFPNSDLHHPAIEEIYKLKHIESFHPCVSHYRREHAPHTRYLTVKLMHEDYLLKFSNTCSYDLYRKIVVNDKKISFTKLGHEECETCEEFTLHDKNHTKENLDDQCDKCQLWSKHINRAQAARTMYRSNADSHFDEKTICVSADLQKIIMLPRIDTFKRVVFIKRLVAYHESFVPVGKKSKVFPYAVVWHEAIAGRCKEEITSTFFAFLMRNRDAENIIIWLDNCAGQNKNWGLFTFLVYMVNSGNISARTLTLNYFEAGHTFMSADHFHHQVELSLKRQRKTYDFSDFVEAIRSANSGKVEVKPMNYTDFYDWVDCSSLYKINRIKPRPYLSDMVQVIAEKGKFTLQYRCSFETEEMKELDFLNKKSMINGFSLPKQKHGPCGVPVERCDTILQKLGGILPQNRQAFWKELPVHGHADN